MLPPILTSGIDFANHVLAFAITLVGFLALLKKPVPVDRGGKLSIKKMTC